MTAAIPDDPKRKILIVDDEQTLTGLLKRLLERRCRYEVHTEHDPRLALRDAKQFHPDVILLDIIMPQMEGGEVARQIRREQTTKDIPIVFISAIAEPIGGYPFLRKPASLEDVIACIELHSLRRS